MQLLYFVEVAKHQHFTRAAEALYITQPALSQAMKRLESEAGMLLFERSGRGVKLTESGRILYDYAQKIIAQMDKMHTEVNGIRRGIAGEVRIGTVLPIKSLSWLRQVISHEMEQAPELQIHVLSEPRERILNMLKIKELDFAVTTGGVPEEFICRPICEDALGVLMSAKDPLAGKKTLSLPDVVDRPICCNNYDMDIREIISEAFLPWGKHPKIVFEGAYPAHILSMVSRGENITFISERDFSDMQTTGYDDPHALVFRSFGSDGPRRQISLIYPDNTELIPAASRLVEELFLAGKEASYGV